LTLGILFQLIMLELIPVPLVVLMLKLLMEMTLGMMLGIMRISIMLVQRYSFCSWELYWN